MSASARSRLLTYLAWWNVAIHALGLICAALWMRPGSPAVSLEERLAYLRDSALPWSLSWGVWVLCTLSLVAFYAALAGYLTDRAAAARFAVTLAAAGAAADLLCYTVHITVLPMLAEMGEGAVPTFRAFDRLAVAGGLIVANGLYVAGGLILNACLHRAGVAPFVIGIGYVSFGCGALLVVAGFADSTWLAMAATPPTMIAYGAWVVLVARALEGGGMRRPEGGG